MSWSWLTLRSQLADPFGEVQLAVQEGAGDSPHFRDATEVHFLATVYESADGVFGPLPCSRSPSFSMLDHREPLLTRGSGRSKTVLHVNRVRFLIRWDRHAYVYF
jgi:hypothetical protein